MKQRDSRGRYKRVYRTASRWEVLTLYSVLGGILLGIAIDVISKPHVFEVVRTVEAAEIVVEPEEVKVEIVYNWTQERIIEEINKVFPDAPIMLKVAKCEGVVDGKLDIKAYNPTNNSHDKGIFQISELHHGKRIKQLGFDMYNPIDNLKFARILYDESGLAPWIWSKPCWSK